jgi:hypothetical protein
VRWRIHASTVKAVLLSIFYSATTQFSSSISASTGDVCAYKFMCHLWKLFNWRFLSRQRHSFLVLFQSQQWLCALVNPCVSCWSSFVDDFCVGIYLVFLHYFWVNRGLVRWWIHASPVDAVSLTISESTATLFSLTISESTGVVCTYKFICHVWKLFRWWFLSQERRSFPLLY